MAWLSWLGKRFSDIHPGMSFSWFIVSNAYILKKTLLRRQGSWAVLSLKSQSTKFREVVSKCPMTFTCVYSGCIIVRLAPSRWLPLQGIKSRSLIMQQKCKNTGEDTASLRRDSARRARRQRRGHSASWTLQCRFRMYDGDGHDHMRCWGILRN